MPVVVDPVTLDTYARFPPEIDRDWLGRVTHLTAAEVESAQRRTGDTTQLGYAVQLVTVRAIGTFLPDPSAVPAPITAAIAHQLDISDPAALAAYRELPVRWRHAAEIRTRYGYRDFAAQPGHFLLVAWLYRQAWADELGPSVLFRAAHRRLLAEQVLLPGHSVLARLVASVRERAARRLHTRLLTAAPVELRARLEKLLLVPDGQRRRVEAWTFGRKRAPGPVLRVRQGDRVVVRLRNRLPVATSVHWHGVNVPNSQDGVAGLTQDAVRPGSDSTYTFDATEAGTYWYHAHQDSADQVERGLFGALVVDPAPGVPEPVDRVVLVHTRAVGATATDQDGAGSAVAAAGQRVRVRVINTDNTVAALTVTGAPFRVAALDGHDLHDPGDLTATAVPVPAGGRVDLTYTQPTGHAVRVDASGEGGTASYRTTSTTNGPGGATASAADPGPTPETRAFDVTRYGTPGPPTPTDITLASPFTKRFTVRIASRLTFHDGQLTAVNAINDRLYPYGDMFMVQAGDLAEVTITNRSLAPHPLHLHGHTFTVLTRDGKPLTGTPLRLDTLQVDPGQTWTVAFRANNPGLWMFHCHNLPHAARRHGPHARLHRHHHPLPRRHHHRQQPRVGMVQSASYPSACSGSRAAPACTCG